MILARMTEWHVGDHNAQSLAKIAWAFATAGQFHTQLFPMLARVVEQCIGDFTVHEHNNASASNSSGKLDAGSKWREGGWI